MQKHFSEVNNQVQISPFMVRLEECKV